ncbi:hypothetical protein Q4543_04715 [Salipiger sp. 1_MG-2023]|uniref:hypothetical protein n=1 Tax=Salipiger sp. 1_MG-2023 TaxID=3062665 RepID=UPI0026E1C913|nr:hypothetical protein [Salipiger sp. 1_MG-2023]MDO6584814.1 hypothetical protein [Salipiger sp. 1_MG-2023]
MSIWLEAARKSLCQTDRTDITDRTSETRTETCLKTVPAEVPSVLSVCQYDGIAPIAPATFTAERKKAYLRKYPETAAGVAGGKARQGSAADNLSFAEDQASKTGVSPYPASVGNRLTTWTGRVVSLDAWRSLTDWECHGPRGKHWSGITRQWEDADHGR